MPLPEPPGFRRRMLVVQASVGAAWMLAGAAAALTADPLRQMGKELPYPTELWLGFYDAAFRFPLLVVPTLVAGLVAAQWAVERRGAGRGSIAFGVVLGATLLGASVVASYLPFVSSCTLINEETQTVLSCGRIGFGEHVGALCSGALAPFPRTAASATGSTPVRKPR